MKKNFLLLLVLFFIFGFNIIVYAHPGGTDSLGCHTCRTNCSSWGLFSGEYHCHQSKGFTQPSDPISSHWGDGGSGYTTPEPSYSYPTYSAPSCPLMSLYDSLSKSCKCITGYIVGKNILGEESCVLADNVCTDKMGYGAQYNTTTQSCECRNGYIYDGSKCVSELSYCIDMLGLMSEYNSLTKQCECMSGYEFNGTSCEYKIKTISCPINSSKNFKGGCSCDFGYEINESKNGCIIKCQQNATRFSGKCLCDKGFVLKGSTCISHMENCKLTFGENVQGTPDVLNDNSSKCQCNNGYEWSSDGKLCIEKQVKINKNLNEPSITKNYVVSQKNDLNIREKKSISSKKIGILKKKIKYEVIDLSDKEWIKIKFGNKEGWVSRKLVKIN